MDSYPVLLNTPWINHSLSGLAAWSITVSASTGTIIIAALALLIQIAGEATWTIAAFALHQARATDKPETGLFRQSQVVLRNPGTSLGTGIRLIQVGWKWHGVVHLALLKSIGLALIPLCLFGGFIAAGVMVSQVTALPNEVSQVLLWPMNCGIQNWTGPTDQPTQLTIGGKWSSDTRWARQYATNCYRPGKSLACTTLPVQQLPFTVSMNATCPVGKRCFGGVVRFDTGLLNSHKHLGINADHSSRVQFQMTTTCAPMNISDTLRDDYDPYINTTYTTEIFTLQTWMGPYGKILNSTYELSTYQSLVPVAYQVEPRRKMAGPGVSSGDIWEPNPEFRLPDKDLTVALIIFNNVMYSQETYDPVFSADGTYQLKQGNLKLKLPDHWFSAIACADQLRICNPNAGGKCTPLTGAYLVRPKGLGFTEQQEATAERIIDARLHSTVFDVLYQQGGNALLASDLLDAFLKSPPLPRNQWVLETTKWFQTTMANVQHRIVEFPNNQWDTHSTGGVAVVKPEDWFSFSPNAMRDLCNQQLVRSSDEYQTFSLEGIVIVIVVSVVLVVLSCTLEFCVFRPQRRRNPEGPRRYKRLAYGADGQLQLLRVVLEKEGYGDWEDKLDGIPYRVPKDLSNEKDIRSVFEEPQSFQMRKMQRSSVDARVYRPGHGYHQVSHGYGSDAWPNPAAQPSPALGYRPNFGHVEDSRPLLYGR